MCFKISCLRDFVPDQGSVESLGYWTPNMWLQLSSDPEPTVTKDVAAPCRLPADLYEATRGQARGTGQLPKFSIAGRRVVRVIDPAVEAWRGRCIAFRAGFARARDFSKEWQWPVAVRGRWTT